MKWKNYYRVNHCFFITSTVNRRLAILNNQDISQSILQNLAIAKAKFGSKLLSYVIMPDHWHLLVYFERGEDCLSFVRDFKRFTSQKIIRYLEDNVKKHILSVFRYHARGRAKYSVWEEQARVIALYTSTKIRQKMDYIHNNPVKRKLATTPERYTFSSASFYYGKDNRGVPIDEWTF